MSDTPLGSTITAERIEALELALEEMTGDRDYWKERATTDWDRRTSPEAELTAAMKLLRRALDNNLPQGLDRQIESFLVKNGYADVVIPPPPQSER